MSEKALVVEFALLIPADNAVDDLARVHQLVGRVQNELKDFDPKSIVQMHEVRWSS